MPRPKQQPQRLNPWRLFVGAMIPNWLLERPELSLGAKVVYARLAQYAGRKGYAYPRVATLAKAVGLKHKRQVQRYLAELKDHELIEAQGYERCGAASRYYFLNHPWMYAEEVPETTPETDGDKFQEENDQEIPSDSNDVADPHDTSVTRGVTHPSPPPGQIRHPIEENQGRDSEKWNQGGAVRRHISGTPHSGPGAGQAHDTEHSAEPCDNGELSSGGDEPTTSEPSSAESPSLEKLEAVVATTSAKTDDTKAIQAAKRKAKAAQRKRNAEKLKAARLQEQREANLQGGTNGSKLSPEMRKRLKKCEGLWLSGVREKWSGRTFPAWSGKERGQCVKLLKLYPGDLVGQTLSYVITNWDTIKERMFKGKGTFPTVGMVLRLHDVLFPEAETFGSVLAVKAEYEQWFKDNPRKLLAPPDLQQRYEAILPELKSLGLD